MPPETEATHFNVVMSKYATQFGMDRETFTEAYNNGQVKVPELDLYFAHDRSLREVRPQDGAFDEMPPAQSTKPLSVGSEGPGATSLATIRRTAWTDGRRSWSRWTSTRCCTATRQTSPRPSGTVFCSVACRWYSPIALIRGTRRLGGPIASDLFGGRFVLKDGSVETPEAWFAAAARRKEVNERCETSRWRSQMVYQTVVPHLFDAAVGVGDEPVLLEREEGHVL